MKGLKITGIVSLIIGLVICLVIDIWYLWVLLFAPEKVLSTTFEVGLQTTIDGNTKYFMEVNVYNNCFEVKYNYMLDENQEAFFSQGLQYYNPTESVVFKQDIFQELIKSSTNVFGWKTRWIDNEDRIYFDSTSTEKYNYMSSDDYANSPISTNPIDENTYFKIQLDGELYLMKFKGKVKTKDEIKVKRNWFTSYITSYVVYDADRLNGSLWSGSTSLANGTSHAIVFEFGDMFDYYSSVKNSDGVYEKVDPVQTDKIITDIKSYYSILVTKHDGNIQKASDSLFNCVAGNSGFNLTGIESEDYLFGRTNITAGNGSFKYVVVDQNSIALKLKKEFINQFEKYGEQIQLKVLIDLDELKRLGLEFKGFTADNNLDKFNIISCETVESIDGELVYTEVAYD